MLTFESSIFDTVSKLVPSVTGVYLPPSGSCVFTAYVKIKKRVPGEGKSAGMAALAAEPNLKIAIVLDDDIDFYNEEQVLWAIATHMEGDRDLAMIPYAMGAHLNPSAYGEVRTEKGPMNTNRHVDKYLGGPPIDFAIFVTNHPAFQEIGQRLQVSLHIL